MYAIASFNDAGFQKLADITDAIKQEYCDRHGYKYHVMKDGWKSPAIGFNKIFYTMELFQKHPEYEWILFCECDATITNFNIKIEDKVDNNYHFMVAVDINEINAGVFMARNTEEGRSFLQFIIDKEPEYRNNPQAEQAVMIDHLREWRHIAKVVPQRYMNSFQYPYYRYGDHRDIPPHRDVHGNLGTWEKGDWICHWPGMPNDARITLATQMKSQIIK